MAENEINEKLGWVKDYEKALKKPGADKHQLFRNLYFAYLQIPGYEEKAREAAVKSAKEGEKKGVKFYNQTGEMYEFAGIKEKAIEFYKKTAEAYKNGQLEANNPDRKAKSYFEKAKNLEEELKKGGKSKTIDNIITSILAFGGLGLIFTFFSKPRVISAQNVQLAPPFPNYLIYVFLAMLLVGGIYFIAKRFMKKKDIIPLSF
jgi:tetratricopeptide (TPR) repeat protein